MVYSLVANIQTVAYSAQPIDKSLSGFHIIFVRFKASDSAYCIFVHLINCICQGYLRLVAYMVFPDGFLHFSLRLHTYKIETNQLRKKLVSKIKENCAFLLTSR